MIEFSITTEENGKPLGDVLKRRGFSNRLVRKLKRTPNGITLAGEVITTVTAVKTGQVIRVGDTADSNPPRPNGELNVPVLFENEAVIVFDKPSNMAVHPSVNHYTDTLGNFFAYRCKDLTFRPINRLDRDTSGCVIVAKNQYAASVLQKNYEKKYYGLAKNIPFSGGRICVPIAREGDSIIKRKADPSGQPAATDWQVIARQGDICLIEFFLETGRTHQIRVHMAYKGYPLLGDEMYGGDTSQLKKQALHCGEVSFVDPKSKERITVKSPIPFDF